MPTTLLLILALATASAELCDNTCTYHGHSHSNNGICEDGGSNARLSICASGTDCTDCGPRIEIASLPSSVPTEAGDAWAGLRASEALYEGEWLYVWVAGLLALTAMEWARYAARNSAQFCAQFIDLPHDLSGTSIASRARSASCSTSPASSRWRATTPARRRARRWR